MKAKINTISLLVSICLAWSMIVTGHAEEINHAKFKAQKAALKVLEGEDPFILREAWWHGRIEPGKAKLLRQQLFQENIYQYWFAVADPESELLLNLYDGKGNLIKTKPITSEEGKCVVGLKVKPENSGMYYLRLALSKESKSAQDWALIYAYK